MLSGHKKQPKSITSSLIAPCGMNCRLCRAFVRERNACPGCKGSDTLKSKTAAGCPIKNCPVLKTAKKRFCFACKGFPCDKLSRLDKRYRSKYGMSMIDNLDYIKQFGIRKFVSREKTRWTCKNCGELLCVHKPLCISCGISRETCILNQGKP